MELVVFRGAQVLAKPEGL